MYHTWMDVKYANLLSSSLKRFKVKANEPYLANCRCPICGDSTKNASKARGYIYQNKDKLRFRCHNCGAGMTFPFFLKTVNPDLHNEYVKERFLNDGEVKKVEKKTENLEFSFPDHLRKGEPLSKLKKISQLKWDHPVKQYVVSRKIPNYYHSKMFYAPKFKAWTNTMIPNKFNLEQGDEPRLVIPFFDEDKNFFGYQGRSLKKNDAVRYISIMLRKDKTKIYGLDTVNKSKKVFVFEGPIDSMFISNSVAMAGSDVSLPSFPDFTIVLDNEPRNKEIVKLLDKNIEKGYNVCIWPSNVHEKDINDMILAGYENEDLQAIINANTYNGLMARMKLAEWRKV